MGYPVSFSDYWSELRGYCPDASPFLLQKLVNRAWFDIRDAHDWSWLEGFTTIQIPALQSTGTVTFTQFTNTMTCDANATAALTPLIIPSPAGQVPLVAQQNSAGQPLIGTGYQIRVTNGPLYSIIGATGNPLVLTLDRIISEASQTTVGYQAYRAYLGAPCSDFLNWTSITNPLQQYTIRKKRLLGSQDQLNAVDPGRQSTEDMYFLFSLYADANGMPIKEMWPGPINQTGYLGVYKRRGTDLSATVDIPPSIDAQLLLERARMYAAQYKATQPRLPNDTTDWVATWKTHELNYLGDPRRPGSGLLEAARKKDTELKTPPPIIRRGPYSAFPFSSQFCASHDVNRMLQAFPTFWGSGGWN